ncbi:uncharacterized protein LOC129593998 [Paramacrobiotus metropolitanus]|uniref:uncharacterized protein LOC129593998 n=1 Tax=Paramacrobiotus metropolitanus TaxID=2943436 RepID=UPI002445B15A|nr:uncharacterized protein LOC129593998 [Paramacrobiotus metropolitanus]
MEEIRNTCLFLVQQYTNIQADPIILLPPTNVCLWGCKQKIKSRSGEPGSLSRLYTDHDSSESCTLNDIDGSQKKCWKFSLLCKRCGSRYSYATYSEPTLKGPENISHSKRHFFYDTERAYVAVSNEVFWTRRLCRLLTSDIYWKHSSFQGFAASMAWSYAISEDYNRKQTAEAFFRFHIEAEIRERRLLKTPFSEHNYDLLLPSLNEWNRQSLYPHIHTTECLAKGCRFCTSFDGIWKLTHLTCSFKIITKNPAFGDLNFPSDCPEEPLPGLLFCGRHAGVAAENNLPLTRKELKLLTKTKVNSSSTEVTALSFSSCNKNRGLRKYRIARSRGWLFAVSSAGIIRTFRPLYGSESSSQVFYAMAQYLLLEIGDDEKWTEEERRKFVVAYDDICHVDGLLQARNDLPFSGSGINLWRNVVKIIDRFHIGNHKKQCQSVYNPSKLLDVHGLNCQFNTETCEQVLSKFGKYKQSAFMMGKQRQEFFLNRMVKIHNSIVEQSLAQGREHLHFNGRRRCNNF